MAALGLLSGLVSAIWGQSFELEALQPLAKVFLLAPGTLLIGFAFAVAAGTGMTLWARVWLAAIVVPLTAMYAWSAAIHTAIRLQRNTGDDVYLLAAGLGAGAVGAGLTHLGCALVAPPLRRAGSVAMTCAAGALAGLLFFAGERKLVDERLLFLVWQPAVAFCIGWGLRAPRAGT